VKLRTTTVPYRDWPLRKRTLERLYRWTHGGQIRTLVIRDRSRKIDDAALMSWWPFGPREPEPEPEPEVVMLPRLGAHLRVWGSGHACEGDEPHEQCVCECGVPAPYEEFDDFLRLAEMRRKWEGK